MHTQNDDRWIAVIDPLPDAPADPADDPSARGIIADRSDTAALIAVSDAGIICGIFYASLHRVLVCRPGPPPKLIHLFVVRPLPPVAKMLASGPVRSYVNPKPDRKA